MTMKRDGYEMKRIALINDVTGYSKCSIATQLLIISAMAIEVCICSNSNFINKYFIIQIYFLMIIQIK